MKQTFFYTCGLLLLACHSSSRDNNAKTLKEYSYLISTQYVKDYLASTSVPHFDYFTAEPDVSIVNGRYTVKYHFTANNSVGDQIQSNYICDLKYRGGAPEQKENWELEALQVDGATLAGTFGVPEKEVSANTATDDPIQKYYHIEKTSGNGYYLKIYVYLTDKSKLQDANAAICRQYDGKYSQVLDIWYLDKKNFADYYISIIDNKNISDAAFEKIDKHLICTYEQFSGQTGAFDMNQ